MDFEPAANLPGLLFVDETTLAVSTKIMCNECGKIFQRTDIYRKYERMCGKLNFTTIKTTKSKCLILDSKLEPEFSLRGKALK